MSSWSSYPSIFTLGHRAIKDLLNGDVLVEEKVDGSQFSFGMVPINKNAEGADVDVEYDSSLRPGYALKIRSKGCVMHIQAPEKMFRLAAATVENCAFNLHPGWTYRGEFLAKPKHNALAYDRVPTANIIIFDITVEDGGFLSYEEKAGEAKRLGLEVVPRLFTGKLASIEQVRQFMGTVSVLGGQAIEGVVVKPINYDLYGTDKKVLLGKFVSEAFKEVHRKSWGESNPTNKDIIQKICDEYSSAARWNKAIQHLREAGKLLDDVKDIGPLIREIPEDVLKECEDEIKDKLFTYAWGHIKRGLTRGFPEYYKELLMKRQFEEESERVPTGSEADVCDSLSVGCGDGVVVE